MATVSEWGEAWAAAKGAAIELGDLRVTIMALTGGDPAPGSQGANELAEDLPALAWSGSPVRDALAHATNCLTVATDALVGMLATIERPAIVYSPFILARTVLETTARAWHLLAPGIDATTRSARGANELIEDLRQQRKHPRATVEKIDGQLGTFEGPARRASIAVLDKHGKFLWILERRPGPTEMVDVFVREAVMPFPGVGEGLFRSGSAASHGGNHAIVSLVEDQQAGTTRLALSESRAAVIVAAAALCFQRALARQQALHGWTSAPWSARHAAIADRLQRVGEPT